MMLLTLALWINQIKINLNICMHIFYIFIFSILYFLFFIVFGTGPSSAHGDWAGLDPSGPAWPLAQASGQAAFTRQSAWIVYARWQQLVCNYISNAQCWGIILQTGDAYLGARWRRWRAVPSFFLWFWKSAMEKKKPVMLMLSSVGFLFPCPPLCLIA